MNFLKLIVLISGAVLAATCFGSAAPAQIQEEIAKVLTRPPQTQTAVEKNPGARFETGVSLRNAGKFAEAEAIFEELLGADSEEGMRKQALLELASCARDQNQLPRAQEILAQYMYKWPGDSAGPEVLLRQGRIYRDMGLSNLAFAKFYAVMTSALLVNKEKLDYYEKVVQEAQAEIAETHYSLGKFSQAAEFYGRLLRQNAEWLDRPLMQFRLIRSLAASGQHEEVTAQASDFLARNPSGAAQPEVRFHLALALRELGRNSAALQQVMLLLQEQRALSPEQPELLAYWQKRAGNEVANQLYQSGDYTRALEVYLALCELGSTAEWQLPVLYQVGLTYERLSQPEMAIERYREIVRRESDLGANAAPGMKAIVEMARWRANFVDWQKEKARELPLGALKDEKTESKPAKGST